jgi:hypothetical protein
MGRVVGMSEAKAKAKAKNGFTDWTQTQAQAQANHKDAKRKRSDVDDVDDVGIKLPAPKVGRIPSARARAENVFTTWTANKHKDAKRVGVAPLMGKIPDAVTAKTMASIDHRLPILTAYYTKTYGADNTGPYSPAMVADIECASQLVLNELRMDLILHAWVRAFKRNEPHVTLPKILLETTNTKTSGKPHFLPYFDPFVAPPTPEEGEEEEEVPADLAILDQWEGLRVILATGQTTMFQLTRVTAAFLLYNTIRATTMLYWDPKVTDVPRPTPVCRFDPKLDQGKAFLAHAAKIVALTPNKSGYPEQMLPPG